MDCEIDLHEKPFYALVTAQGVASVDGLPDLLAELSTKGSYPEEIGILLDLRRLDIENITLPRLGDIIRDIKQYLRGETSGPCAAVVNNPVAFGVARMYGLYGGDLLHSNYNVFYNLDDAVLWLLGCVLLQERGNV